VAVVAPVIDAVAVEADAPEDDGNCFDDVAAARLCDAARAISRRSSAAPRTRRSSTSTMMASQRATKNAR
jgi:hypothetical protein